MVAHETLERIPAVDLEDFRSQDPHRRKNLIDTVAAGLRDTGFIFVKSAGITQELPETYSTFKRLFDLPISDKLKYERGDIHHQRGYTPPETEIGIFCQRSGPKGEAQPDAKENWFIGPEMSDGHPLVKRYPELYAPNVWPSEVPELKIAARSLYDKLFGLGKEALRALEVHLDYDEGFFDKVVEDSPTSLRPLHYPAVPAEKAEETVWGCEHTDINLVTVLPASTKPGLWVKTRKGAWIPGTAPEGHSIVQVGDMLQHMTGGHLLSAHHKIVVPEGGTTEGRYSSALFVHARSDYVLRVDKNLAEADFGMESDISAGDFLYRRLGEISLAKQAAREED